MIKKILTMLTAIAYLTIATAMASCTHGRPNAARYNPRTKDYQVQINGR